LSGIIAGTLGTTVSPKEAGIVFAH
jgi:hypothetical protein